MSLKSLKYSVLFKVVTIVFITLLLFIPTMMVQNLIQEREHVQEEAITEVGSKWGNAQTITGPFISIPYYVIIQETINNKTKVSKVKRNIQVLPNELNIKAVLFPEKRYRGIYEVIVYNSKINLKGQFIPLDFSKFDITPSEILYDQAKLIVGINDLRGIEKEVNVKWNQHEISFNPGVPNSDVIGSGIYAEVPLEINANQTMNFDLSLDLKGSQQLYFTPVGKITNVEASSSWSNPSFNGSFLPDKRIVTDTGFVADWNVLHLNRNYPQQWLNNDYDLSQSSFGVDLIIPMDNYQKTYRSVKYAFLLISFTFLVFFFIEILNKVFIHPIQYILVGLALVIFYVLLLSISEHLSFNVSYFIAAIATLTLIGLYIRAILKSKKLMILIVSILSILYLFIFIIIQLQDYALLIGSIGVFIILALTMYYSRKIDWYHINLKEDKDPEEVHSKK